MTCNDGSRQYLPCPGLVGINLRMRQEVWSCCAVRCSKMAHLTAELSQDLLTTYPYTSASCRTYSRPSSGPSALKSDTTILSDSEEEHYEMVQTYNAVPVSVEHDDADADDSRGAEHEGSALLGSSASSTGLVRDRAQKEGPATLTSSVGNLANTVIGSGELRSLIYHLSLPLSPASSIYSIYVVSFCSRFLVLPSFRHAYLSSGTSFPRYGPATVVHVRDDLICAMTIGTRFCGYHPRHVDLRVFWCCRSVRSVSPFRLCAPHSAPPLFFLRCRKPHLSTCGRFL
jgi:hypothetical protein